MEYIFQITISHIRKDFSASMFCGANLQLEEVKLKGDLSFQTDQIWKREDIFMSHYSIPMAVCCGKVVRLLPSWKAHLKEGSWYVSQRSLHVSITDKKIMRGLGGFQHKFQVWLRDQWKRLCLGGTWPILMLDSMYFYRSVTRHQTRLEWRDHINFITFPLRR